MVINQNDLCKAQPIYMMSYSKHRKHGVSYGLGEAGYDIRTAKGLLFHPFRRFRLSYSMEKFQMPPNLVGIVHDKSTWARQGLSVFNTVIEPGWEGYLTIEIVYHGYGLLYVPAGAGIAQVLFHEVTQPVKYDGKYQGQEKRIVKSKFQ
jgi:dCTP deaminase